MKKKATIKFANAALAMILGISISGCDESPTGSSEKAVVTPFDATPYIGKKFRVTIIGAVFAPTDYTNAGWDGNIDQATISKFKELASASDIAIGSQSFINIVSFVTSLAITGTQLPEPLGTSQIDTGDGYWRNQKFEGIDNFGKATWDTLRSETENSLFVDWMNSYQPSYIFNLRSATKIKIHLVDYDPFSSNDEAGTCTITHEEIAQALSNNRTIDVPCLVETRNNVVSVRINSSMIE